MTSAPLTSAPASPDVATPPKSVDGSQHPSASSLTPSGLSAVAAPNVPANSGESPAPIDGTSSHPQPFSRRETPATLENAHTNNPKILPVSNIPHVDPTPMNISSSINIDVT